MDRKTDNIPSGDEDGIPAQAIRDMIRRSLASAQPPSDFFRFSFVDLDSDQPLAVQDRGAEIEIGPPQSQRRQDGLLTGFQDLDRIVGGLRRGEVITVAGLPSSGSSTFVQNIVRKIVSGTADKSVLFYNLDSTSLQVVRRVLGAGAKVDWHLASGGLLRDAEWTRLAEAVQRLWNSKLTITDDRFVSLDDLYETCAQRKRGIGLDLIVLDRVNILGVDYGGDTPPLGDTMAELKAIAERLDVPVLLTYTGDPAKADDTTHRLSIHSLPSAVQVYSDVLTLLHRPDQWEIQGYHQNEDRDEMPELQKGLEVVELNVARQTGGSSETLRLAFNARWGRFDNVLWD